ncbi:MAG: hypothetical protein V4494_01730 [Chlamydiota bacterium]
MSEAGKRTRAGQEVRLVEIPADTGKFGIFENLHGFESGKAFAEALEAACRSYYGNASREFLKCLIADRTNAIEMGKKIFGGFVQEHYPVDTDAQVGRVLNRFVLVAVAGELAASFGITGWNEGEAIQASLECFKEWLRVRGGVGSQEESTILSQVKRYFEQHGESRFTFWEASCETKTINRTGFRRNNNEEIEFYVFPERYKSEICQGYDPSLVAKVCAKHGLLKLSAQGECTRSERLPSKKNTTRCYLFTSKVLGEEDV